MSTVEKFTAAINVIRSLPKNGAYQPSKELLLRFYAYYKQATIGPNHQPKPSFWDVVNRAKWQAWDNLGNMSKEKAMQEYVDELKKIVETMAYTNPVADFVSSLDSFYESVSIDDLEMVVGPIERGNLIERFDRSNAAPTNEHLSVTDTDIDEECFHDVMEVNNLLTGEQKKTNTQNINQQSNTSEYIEESVPNNHSSISQQKSSDEIEIQYSNEFLDEFQLQVRNIVSTMKYDLDNITDRVAQIELKLNEIKNKEPKTLRASHRNVRQMILLMAWPVLVQLIFMWFQRRNRRKV